MSTCEGGLDRSEQERKEGNVKDPEIMKCSPASNFLSAGTSMNKFLCLPLPFFLRLIITPHSIAR